MYFAVMLFVKSRLVSPCRYLSGKTADFPEPFVSDPSCDLTHEREWVCDSPCDLTAAACEKVGLFAIELIVVAKMLRKLLDLAEKIDHL